MVSLHEAPESPRTHHIQHGQHAAPGKFRLRIKVSLVGVPIVVLGVWLGASMLSPAHSDGSSAPRTAAIAFVSDLQTGSHGDAESQLCTMDQASPAAFIDYWKAQTAKSHRISGFDVVGVHLSGRPGHETAEVEIVLTFAGGDQQEVPLPLVHLDRWRPCPAS